MRVLHVSQPTTAGVARVVAQLAHDQSRRGWDVVVAAPADGTLARDVREAGARWVCWPATRAPGASVLGEVRRLARIVRSESPDVVHLHSSKAGLAGRLALRGRRPTVFQPHAWSFLAADSAASGPAATWERVGARWAHVLAVVSAEERRAGEERGVVGTWRELGNGVDLQHHRPPSAQERAAARTAVGAGDGPLVVCLGRLSVQKGQDVLLHAWPAVAAAVPGATLALVGDGPLRAELAGAAPPGVRLAGATAEPRSWLWAADVVVLPSRWEGLSLALLEGLACGACVVTTRVGGAEEAVPSWGAVVPVGDSAALAAAVTARLQDADLVAAERAAARRQAEARYDVAAVGGRAAQVYRELTGGSR